jgi:hypothetical protein
MTRVPETPREVIKTIAEEVVKTIEQNLKEQAIAEKEGQKGKEEILTVLSRAAYDPKFMKLMSEDTHDALKEYYNLTSEQRAALASGDIQKIESWVGKLDKRLATWLWSRLSQEKW